MAEHLQKFFVFGRLDHFTIWQRLFIRVAGFMLYSVVVLNRSTIRVETLGEENVAVVEDAGKAPIYTFWHNRIAGAAYYFGDRDVLVLSSQSFDGELAARCLMRLGFGIVKGSSSRGGISAMVEMNRAMGLGYSMAIAVDGPRGPLHIAKAGPVVLAKTTGNPMVPCVVEFSRYWKFKSWDGFRIPYPFSRSRVIIGEPIYVDAEADEDQIEAGRLELQDALDDLVARGAEWQQGLA